MSEQRRIRILVNPSARSGRGLRALQGLRERRVIDIASRIRVEWIESRSAEHFTDLVQRAQDPAAELSALGVAGGDGTVTLALAALAELPGLQSVPLAILPTGSGNDFAHDIGASRSSDRAYQIMLHGTPRWVDCGSARSLSGNFFSRFCCVASVGLDELALRRIHGSRWPRSKALNIYAALRGLIEYRPRAVRVRWASGSFEGEVMFCAVTNTRSYGGGFRVSPKARIDDGQLDVCIVARTSKTRLLMHFPKILRGTHGGVPEVLMAQSPWVEIESLNTQEYGDRTLPLCIDGELPSGDTPVELRCQERSLWVMGPPNAAPTAWQEAA